MEYLIYLLVGFGGVIAHSLIKLKQMAKDYEKANLYLSFEDYLKKDKYAIILSFLVVFLWLALFGEAAQQYPKILTFTRFSFFAMGAIGSYIVQAGMSKAKSELRKKIDEKTNQLDEITNMEHWVFYPALTSSNDEILTVGNQQYGITAGNMSSQTQGVFYTQTINQQLFLCAGISAFNSPLTANIRKAGTQQTGYHDPIKRPK